MKTIRRVPPGERSVSTSELAQMGRCEKLVTLEHLHGSRRKGSQQRDRERGLLAHRQFQREGLDAMAAAARGHGKRLITTGQFGDGWQIQVLYRFWEVVWRPIEWGRRLIRLNHRAALGIWAVLRRWTSLQVPIRSSLGSIAAGFRSWLRRSGEDS